MPGTLKEKKRISTLFSLIIAGESIFFLPFVLARIFRPTLLEVSGIMKALYAFWPFCFFHGSRLKQLQVPVKVREFMHFKS